MNLLDPVERLKGVGPKTAEILKKNGIKTVRDFFYNLPRDYDNYRIINKIKDIRDGKVVIRGRVESLKLRRARRRNMTIIEGEIRDETGAVKVTWFNQSYLMKQLKEGKEYYFTGDLEFKYGRYGLTSPAIADIAEIDTMTPIKPIYVAHGAITSQKFHRLLLAQKAQFARIPNLLPTVKPGLRREALYRAHFPEKMAETEWARQYLGYEELFKLILAGRLNKQENQRLEAAPIEFQVERIKKFLAALPFQITNAQRRAAWEIFQDMGKQKPMNRLLQGDVGAGKTLVAAMVAYMAAGSGTKEAGNTAAPHTQIALLAPTAILATQHYEGLSQILEGFGVRTALLVGATKGKEALKKQIREGEIDFVIGTHALLTDDTEFSKLGLVIIDEQHRFGVEQRQKLLLKSPKGLAPHLLSMTATPIPRSLQLTVFGDLDVSVLDEMPKGRQPIRTQILREIEMRERLYPEIIDTVRAGSQGYWICKAIDDNPRTETTSVKKRAERLQREFPKLSIEYLHGRMKPAEKDEIMGRFANGEIDILVSTTVVEVGVDVPNATLMVIENAENYGLAQLHQLRGRVGRGSKASECFLLTESDKRPSRRLLELERSNDGFHLAEVDLRLRGPGEIYGALQHGALDLKIASITDTKLIARARKDVEEFMSSAENLAEGSELMEEIREYQQITTLN